MNQDLEKLMSQKSDESLQVYIENRKKFVPEEVEAAISEQKKRGKIFSEEQLKTIRQDLLPVKEQKGNSFFNSLAIDWKKNVVSDLNAPEYYSERAVFFLTVCFSVFFGSIIFALNLNKIGAKKGIIEVPAFGIVYTGLQIWILSFIPQNSSLTIWFNVGGAMILHYYFWKKYMGEETKYRPKPVLLPVIIGIAVMIIFILGLFFESNS